MLESAEDPLVLDVFEPEGSSLRIILVVLVFDRDNCAFLVEDLLFDLGRGDGLFHSLWNHLEHRLDGVADILRGGVEVVFGECRLQFLEDLCGFSLAAVLCASCEEDACPCDGGGKHDCVESRLHFHMTPCFLVAWRLRALTECRICR